MSAPPITLRRLRTIGTGVLVALAAAAFAAPGAEGARDFDRDFLWGTANAGFQSEGGNGRDVDPNSDWYVWTHDPANIADGTVSGDQPEQGPDFWRRFRSDLKLASDRLHNNAFRFSIEWPRIFPRSTEDIDVGAHISPDELERLDRRANQGAVRHYRTLLKVAAKRGLTAFVTLHHWTLPSWLHDPVATRDALAGIDPNADLPPLERGGWLDHDTVAEFRKYAAYLGWKLGGRADYWNTLNEPLVQTTFGYANIPGLFGAYWPPGAFTFTGAIAALTNLESANTVAYNALKRFDRRDADGDRADSQVGPVMNMIAFTPANDASAADREATAHADYLFNRLFLNAVVDGELDADANGTIEPAEQDLHGAKADFVGLNYYFRGRVAAAGAPLTPRIPVLDFIPSTTYASPADPFAAPCPTTCSELGAELYPDGFRQVIGTADSYGLPVYVTENGIADSDDDQRGQYLRDHLAEVATAIHTDGADVRGYFQWSLVDNLEWVYGYGPKFGLYSFDPATLKRTERPSARVYARIVRTGSLP